MRLITLLAMALISWVSGFNIEAGRAAHEAHPAQADTALDGQRVALLHFARGVSGKTFPVVRGDAAPAVESVSGATEPSARRTGRGQIAQAENSGAAAKEPQPYDAGNDLEASAPEPAIVIGETLRPGMLLRKALALLGPPQDMNLESKYEAPLWRLDYSRHGLTLKISSHDKIIQAIEVDSAFTGEFAAGIQMGDSVSKLAAAYGTAASTTAEKARYPGRGLEFRLAEDKVVAASVSAVAVSAEGREVVPKVIELPEGQLLGVNIRSSHGKVRIVEVESDSVAASSGLREGDVISRVNAKAVQGSQAFTAAVRNVSDGKVDEMLLKIEREAENVHFKIVGVERLTQSAQSCESPACVTGTYDDEQGLEAAGDRVSLTVPPNADPSNEELWVRTFRPKSLSQSSGFNVAVELGPDGTTFGEPARLTVQLSEPTALSHLPVLISDAERSQWIPAKKFAVVGDGGTSVSFTVSHFSSVVVWEPPLPESDGRPGLPQAGNLGFEMTSLMPEASTSFASADGASFLYSPFGDLFSVTIKKLELSASVDLCGLDGGMSTFIGAFNASEVQNISDVVVGYALPSGGLGGPTYINTGNLNIPSIGIMFLYVDGESTKVTVFGAAPSGPCPAIFRADIGGQSG